MRVLLLAVVLISTTAHAADDAPGAAEIKSLLTKPKSWSLYLDWTDAATPTDRASKHTWQYFEQDQKLMARQVAVFGGCDVDVTLRHDGFSFRWCPPLEGEPSLNYDPNDPKYPFKDATNPRKLWLQANE
jgi:hypothetical protein